MSEAEFNLLLEAVRTAIANEPKDGFAPTAWTTDSVPQAANDNGPTTTPPLLTALSRPARAQSEHTRERRSTNREQLLTGPWSS